MNNTLLKVSPLPEPTWSWLRINDTDIEKLPQGHAFGKSPLLGLSEKLTIKVGSNDVISAPKILQDTWRYIKDNINYALALSVAEGVTIEEPQLLHFHLDEANPFINDRIDIHAAAGAKATIVLKYTSDKQSACFHGGYFNIRVEKNADLKVIIVQDLSTSDRNITAIQGEVADGGILNVLPVEVGSCNTIGGCDIHLAGKNAFGEISGIYLGCDKNKLDFNYRVEFDAPETEGYITIKGGLAGEAHKVMKSTVDFITGAADSKGREEEFVIALSDKVVNISAPLLLCGEENVSGEHATSTGKPNKEKLYYLMSRGLDELAARKMIVEASFTPILNKIEPMELRDEIRARIQEVVHNA